MYTLIVVDYKSLGATCGYIRDYAGKRSGTVHAVVVDNDTSQDGLQILRAEFSAAPTPVAFEERTLWRFCEDSLDLIYCASGENMGYARGNNLGARIAREIFADPYYIISNNDLILPDVLDLTPITDYFETHPETAVIGPKIMGLDGLPQSPRKHQSAFTKLIAWYWCMGPLKKYVDDVCYDAVEGPCDWVSGCFLFLRADVFHQVGGFDENTFLFCEEIILSARLQEHGYHVAYLPAFSLIHNHGVTVKKTLAIQKGFQISFDSDCYYYKTYKNAPAILLTFARWNFMLYKKSYAFRQKVKSLFPH